MPSGGGGGGGTSTATGTPTDPPCPAGTLMLLDGSCAAVGVPPASCGAGFVSDGDLGCDPILPAEPCADGLIAVPGDTACRPLASCGSPPWGQAPVDGSTQFVDALYPNPDSDGSEAKPWTTIQPAVDAASPGAVVAIAAGSYAESVMVVNAAVMLWGRCPELVSIVASSQDVAAVFIAAGADNSLVHGLSLSGGGAGVLVSDAAEVTIEQSWIHDTGSHGVLVFGDQSATSATVSGSLLQRIADSGVFASGADVSVEASAIRDVLGDGSGNFGFGLYASAGAQGRGGVVMRGSIIERARDVGLYLHSSDALVETSVVRDTQLDEAGTRGWGVLAEGDFDNYEPSTLSLSQSWISGNHETGVVVSISEATLDATVVRDTKPRPGGAWGWGVSIEGDFFSSHRAAATLTHSLIDGHQEVGLFVGAADAVVDGCAIRHALANDKGLFGDGISVASQLDAPNRAHATVSRTLIADNARAGLASFGGVVELGESELSCNAFDLDGEQDYLVFSIPYELTDVGGNRCGCGDEEHACQLVSSNISPPLPPL